MKKDPYKSKDFGILKYSIPEYIKNNNELSKFINEIKEAEIEDGGSGAFYIFLKNKNDYLACFISKKWEYVITSHAFILFPFQKDGFFDFKILKI